MKLYSQTNAASEANMSLPTFERRVRAGRGPRRLQIGRAFVITHADLWDWINAGSGSV
jgi:hypothetical protein